MGKIISPLKICHYPGRSRVTRLVIYKIKIRLSTSLKTSTAESIRLYIFVWRCQTGTKNSDLPAGSRLDFDTDHICVPTPMRRDDWPVARSLL